MLAALSWLTDPEVFEVNKEKPHSFCKISHLIAILQA